ncbi:hypothetical protein [Dactylosporangium darangshiense]|uniref:hypothetical protein n=1 Tax=Dactylosporangium darangshiense TaxID=579108 RepID=UPI003643B1D0
MAGDVQSGEVGFEVGPFQGAEFATAQSGGEQKSPERVAVVVLDVIVEATGFGEGPDRAHVIGVARFVGAEGSTDLFADGFGEDEVKGAQGSAGVAGCLEVAVGAFGQSRTEPVGSDGAEVRVDQAEEP